jgi:3-hydroxyisobutyrate dehydrogenase-like beta-hydroxyacid dehydrogenase
VGFIGLGNMGTPLAGNLVASGFEVVTYDAKSADHNPEGARFLPSAADVARTSEVVVLCLPDGKVSTAVTDEILAAPDRTATTVIDTSTIGVPYSQAIDAKLTSAGVGFVDAAVSGGPAGARARTLAVMYAGADETVRAVQPVLAGLSGKLFHVGDKPGFAQAIKLANNFLSATYLLACSEAVRFATSLGIDAATMLDVINASSGQSSATADKFPNQVLTGKYASGFANNLMSKDVTLYLEAVRATGGPSAAGELTASIWAKFAADEPGVDFTNVYRFVTGTSGID